MPPPVSEVDDKELELFLSEIEKLSIGGAVKTDADDDNGTSQSTNVPPPQIGEQPQHPGPRQESATKEKRNRISNAARSKKAWADFQKVDLSTADDAARADEEKPKISFSITTNSKVNKKKKKAKSSRKHNKPTEDKARTGSNDEASVGGSWLLVLDTCCFLQNGLEDVKDLIETAHRTVNNDSPKLIVADEPILITIPYVVWRELEYQTKSEDDGNAFAARAAIRMLRDRLENGKAAILSEVDLDASPVPTSIRAQTLQQSKDVAAKFVDAKRSSNDDHILACALAERESIFRNRKDGTVLITEDNNLKCKALVNGLQVYTAAGFNDYYRKRMTSLRERASALLCGWGESSLR